MAGQLGSEAVDAMAGPLGGETSDPMADEDLLIGLVKAIEELEPSGKEAQLISQLEQLSAKDIMRLSSMKVPGVNGGRLSLLGHLCVKTPCSEQLLRFMLRTANVNNFEEFENHRMPLLHLAVYSCNHVAVNVLCSFEGIVNLSATSSHELNVLHMAVKSRDDVLARNLCALISSIAFVLV